MKKIMISDMKEIIISDNLISAKDSAGWRRLLERLDYKNGRWQAEKKEHENI